MTASLTTLRPGESPRWRCQDRRPGPTKAGRLRPFCAIGNNYPSPTYGMPERPSGRGQRLAQRLASCFASHAGRPAPRRLYRALQFQLPLGARWRRRELQARKSVCPSGRRTERAAYPLRETRCAVWPWRDRRLAPGPSPTLTPTPQLWTSLHGGMKPRRKDGLMRGWGALRSSATCAVAGSSRLPLRRRMGRATTCRARARATASQSTLSVPLLPSQRRDRGRGVPFRLSLGVIASLSTRRGVVPSQRTATSRHFFWRYGLSMNAAKSPATLKHKDINKLTTKLPKTPATIFWRTE